MKRMEQIPPDEMSEGSLIDEVIYHRASRERREIEDKCLIRHVLEMLYKKTEEIGTYEEFILLLAGEHKLVSADIDELERVTENAEEE